MKQTSRLAALAIGAIELYREGATASAARAPARCLCTGVSRPLTLSIRYAFRRPRFPVILVVADRVFGASSQVELRKLLRFQLRSAPKARLLDPTWEWFELLPDIGVIAPSFVDRRPPTKESLVALVNGRSNRAPGAPVYELPSSSSRTRGEVFAGLLAVLPAS